MPRTRPPYPPEFRLEAVRMLRAGVRSPKQLAAELGCSEQTLRNWCGRTRPTGASARTCSRARGAAAVARAGARKQGAASGARDPEAGRGFLCQGDRSTVTRFRFVEAEAAQFPVSLLCHVVGVTRQGFYAWKRRPPSARELADRKLSERIKQIYVETEEIYGAPRIYSELKLGDGLAIGKKRVARLMRQLGIRGADGKPRRAEDDGSRPEAGLGAGPRRPRLSPGRSRTGSGSATSSTSRPARASSSSPPSRTSSAAGSSAGRCATTSRAELVLDALGMAVSARGGQAAGVVAHSDHGSQYTSLVYGGYAKQSGIDLSMGSIGDPWDRARTRSSCSRSATSISGKALGTVAGTS